VQVVQCTDLLPERPLVYTFGHIALTKNNNRLGVTMYRFMYILHITVYTFYYYVFILSSLAHTHTHLHSVFAYSLGRPMPTEQHCQNVHIWRKCDDYRDKIMVYFDPFDRQGRLRLCVL
jgi:hypothetical protein